ncbi:hypothetical protein S245_052175, partial [Arachis hypogaea]
MRLIKYSQFIAMGEMKSEQGLMLLCMCSCIQRKWDYFGSRVYRNFAKRTHVEVLRHYLENKFWSLRCLVHTIT